MCYIYLQGGLKEKRTCLLEIKLDNTCPRRFVKFSVPKRRWHSRSKFDQGVLVEKNSVSFSLACSYVIPFLISWESGFLILKYSIPPSSPPLRILSIHVASSPAGIRSGFVRTPTTTELALTN
jgi:hypothetical protein